MSDTILRLSDIDPKLAAELNADETVIVFGPTECGACDMTVNLLTAHGVRVIKYSIDDSDHPVIVACKKHLGATCGKVVSPFVFEFGVFSWTGRNGAEILRVSTAWKQKLEAAVA